MTLLALLTNKRRNRHDTAPQWAPAAMTAVYRDITQGGTWKTINDTIWSWGTDISYDWFDVSLDERTVYP